MTRFCPNCGEVVPSNALTCPKCYHKVPPEETKTEVWNESTEKHGDVKRTIRLLLTIIPAFFGILGLGQIFRNYRQHRGYIFLIIGIFLYVIGVTLLFTPFGGILVGIIKTLAGLFFLFLYFLLFLLTLMDSLSTFHMSFMTRSA